MKCNGADIIGEMGRNSVHSHVQRWLHMHEQAEMREESLEHCSEERPRPPGWICLSARYSSLERHRTWNTDLASSFL